MNVFEAPGLRRQVHHGLAGNVRGVIVEDDADKRGRAVVPEASTVGAVGLLALIDDGQGTGVSSAIDRARLAVSGYAAYRRGALATGDGCSMVDERGWATGEAEGADCRAVGTGSGLGGPL